MVDWDHASNSAHSSWGMVFHVLNRANARRRIFAKEADYAAFERVMRETLARKPMRILGYLIMPNHGHLVLWPEHDGELAAFMQRLTTTHVRRWGEQRCQERMALS